VLATAGGEQFRAVIDVMMDEDQIDSILINFVTPFFVDTEGIAKEIAEVSRQKKKPMVCNLMTDRRQWSGVVNILRDGGVPTYDFPGTAARALAALAQYDRIRSREIGEVRQFDDVQRDRATAVLQGAKAEGREFLSAAEVYELLSAYGIPVADWRVASSAMEAAQAAAEIGFPVVVKADSDAIVHKSDVGGVAVDLRDRDAVRSAAQGMGEALGTEGLRFFVQKYCPGGTEIIVGAKAEGELGHLIMFGIGGIHVEQLEDVVFKLSPVTTVEARETLTSIKAAPLLDGVRGAAGVDKEGIVEVIERLSQLVTELPMIQEMDLNPIVAYESGVSVVDARVRV